jgi:hypothetical protein
MLFKTKFKLGQLEEKLIKLKQWYTPNAIIPAPQTSKKKKKNLTRKIFTHVVTT